ncbi:DUF4907 domain-containing protein [Ferruginibacter sp. HRS2-29]|uniref:DUF4907 domain-containing protein n=1 Tax=Ferruginibacter sp. HRS2-29 TaxID=2487334 RepID=UPI0020CBF636|nr:DUF4907 domain-containing protein [Ferruginibacter sp. HRS2-29]MCP9749704.1 DUF4907 domain-containing protein [Ferruginibacter sp. HRS2-29]
MKRSFIFSIAAAMLIAACNTSSADKKKTEAAVITSASYRVENGWAYRILVNDKLYIQQDFIPAISGHRAFPSKSSAENIAGLVVKKMQRHEKPFITPEELLKAGAISNK